MLRTGSEPAASPSQQCGLRFSGGKDLRTEQPGPLVGVDWETWGCGRELGKARRTAFISVCGSEFSRLVLSRASGFFCLGTWGDMLNYWFCYWEETISP